MNLEIVSHCWQYSRLMTYQYASLIRNRAFGWDRITYIVVSAFKDDDPLTELRLRHMAAWERPQNLAIRHARFRKGLLLRRAIGRNWAAKNTDADFVWFADCDYVFGPGCLDGLARELKKNSGKGPLWFPAAGLCTTQPDGDKLIREVTEAPERPPEAPMGAMIPCKWNRAIGGIQIVSGDACRECGYLPDDVRLQAEQETWQRTTEDTKFRRQLAARYGAPGRGFPIRFPNLGRIRHSERGRETKGLVL